MALINVPRTEQPRHTVALNWAHPLLFKADFVLLGSMQMWNPYNKTFNTRVGTPAIGYSGAGIGPIHNNAAYFSFLEPTANGGTTPWTIAGIFVPTAITNNSAAVAGTCELPGSSTQDRCLMISSGGKWEGYLNDGAAKRATSSAAPVVGRADTIIVTTNGAILFCSVKGSGSFTVAVSTTGYAGYTSAEFCVGNANSTILDGIGIPLLIRAQRHWNVSEQSLFLSNPWQIFVRRPRTMLGVPVVAAGGFAALQRRTLGQRVGSRAG